MMYSVVHCCLSLAAAAVLLWPQDVAWGVLTEADSGSAAWKGAESTSLAKDLSLPVGEEERWTLPEVSPGERVALRVTVRRQSETLGGYSYSVQYELNGKPLDAAIDRRTSRLLNKPLSFRRPDGPDVFWNLGDGIWHTFFSPDFTTSPERYGPTLEDEPYTALIEVSDLLKAGKENQFGVRNMISPAGGQDVSLFVSVEMLTMSGQSGIIASSEPPRLTGKPSLEVEKGGGFSLVFDQTRLPFESRFSVPNGAFNHLAAEASKENEAIWSPEVREISPNRWEVSAQGKSYRVDRVIELQNHRVTVEDRYTNLTDEPVGIRLSHGLDLEGQNLHSCRIGGQPSESLNHVFSPENATLFLPALESSIGLVLEDDVLRNHALFSYDQEEKRAGITDDLFSLRPRAEYTSRWSVYFQPSADYFDFINAVRRDWGVNTTLEAPVYFENHHRLAELTDEQARQLLDHRKPKYVVFWEIHNRHPSPDWDNRKVLANGTGLFDPSLKEEIASVREAIARIRRVAPEVKVGAYTHCFFVAPVKPDSAQYRDSWITDSDGKRRKSIYDTGEWVDRLCVYPTLENSYGKEYLKLTDFYLNDLGFDWLYWDESVGPGVTNSDVFTSAEQDSYATFDAWDGNTALINRRKKTIEKPFAMLPLITRPVFEEVIRRAKAKGGFVLFNAAATTRQRIGSPSFVETQDTLSRAYQAHLDSPLAFGYGAPTMKDLRDRLKVGLIYARTQLEYPSEIVERFYPFTPEELHAGWVKGKERIITSVSGEFGWEKDAEKLQLALFDSTGALVHDAPATMGTKGKVSVTVPEGGIAILSRADAR